MTRALFTLLAILTCLTFGGGAASAQEVGSYAHVQAGALNLRTAPYKGSSVLRALPYGTFVSILDRRGDWAKVFVQGAEGNAAEGWVAARFPTAWNRDVGHNAFSRLKGTVARATTD